MLTAARNHGVCRLFGMTASQRATTCSLTLLYFDPKQEGGSPSFPILMVVSEFLSQYSIGSQVGLQDLSPAPLTIPVFIDRSPKSFQGVRLGPDWTQLEPLNASVGYRIAYGSGVIQS